MVKATSPSVGGRDLGVILMLSAGRLGSRKKWLVVEVMSKHLFLETGNATTF